MSDKNKSRIRETGHFSDGQGGLFEKVAFEQRPEGGKGGSRAEAGHARCIRGTFRRPLWLERVSEEKSRR